MFLYFGMLNLALQSKATRHLNNGKMARDFLLALITVLLLEVSGMPAEESTGNEDIRGEMD